MVKRTKCNKLDTRATYLAVALCVNFAPRHLVVPKRAPLSAGSLLLTGHLVVTAEAYA